MLSLLQHVFTLALSLVHIVVQTFESFISLIKSAFLFVPYVTTIVSYMPSELFPFISLGVSIMVLLFLLRR